MGKTICLDFDGVLHAYTSKWRGATCIPDGVVPGAREWCWRQVERGHTLIVASARARPENIGGAEAIRDWLKDNDFPEMAIYPKPIAALYIDDNGWRFEGRFPEEV